MDRGLIGYHRSVTYGANETIYLSVEAPSSHQRSRRTTGLSNKYIMHATGLRYLYFHESTSYCTTHIFAMHTILARDVLEQLKEATECEKNQLNLLSVSALGAIYSITAFDIRKAESNVSGRLPRP